MSELRWRRLWRNVKTDAESHDFRELLTNDALTLHRRFRGNPYLKNYHDTIFREIEVVPWREPGYLDEEGSALVFGDFEDGDGESDGVLEALLADVETRWSPGRFHLMLHSSGWDSRLVSSAIRLVYERRGTSWLGDVLFVCGEWEAEPFREIMRRQGWRDDQWMVVRDGEDPTEYHAGKLDFGSAWRWHNGALNSLVATYLYPVREAQRMKRAPPDDDAIQLWSGDGDSVARGVAARNLELSMTRLYYSIVSALRVEHEKINPLTAIRYSRALARFAWGAGRDVRPELVHRLRPDLAEVWPENHLGRYRTLSPRLREKAQADYSASWYGRFVKPDIETPARIYKEEFWTHYTAASLVEHMLEEGKRIEW